VAYSAHILARWCAGFGKFRGLRNRSKSGCSRPRSLYSRCVSASDRVETHERDRVTEPIDNKRTQPRKALGNHGFRPEPNHGGFAPNYARALFPSELMSTNALVRTRLADGRAAGLLVVVGGLLDGGVVDVISPRGLGVWRGQNTYFLVREIA